MDRLDEFALKAAKEIMIARLQNVDTKISGDEGNDIGDAYQAIYRKICEIAKDAKAKTYSFS